MANLPSFRSLLINLSVLPLVWPVASAMTTLLGGLSDQAQDRVIDYRHHIELPLE